MIVKKNRSISVGYMLLINLKERMFLAFCNKYMSQCHHICTFVYQYITGCLCHCCFILGLRFPPTHFNQIIVNLCNLCSFYFEKKMNCLKINVHVQLSCFGSSLLPRSYSGYGLSIRYPMDYPSGIHGYDYWIIHSFYYHNPYMMAY